MLKVCQRLGAVPPDPRVCDRLVPQLEPPFSESCVRAWHYTTKQL